MATLEDILFTSLMKKQSPMSFRVHLATSRENVTNGNLIEQEFIGLTSQICVVPGLSHSPIKAKCEVGKSEIFLVFPSFLQYGCHCSKHHIFT